MNPATSPSFEVLLAVLLGLSGCGSEDGDGSQATEGSTTGALTATSAATAIATAAESTDVSGVSEASTLTGSLDGASTGGEGTTLGVEENTDSSEAGVGSGTSGTTDPGEEGIETDAEAASETVADTGLPAELDLFFEALGDRRDAGVLVTTIEGDIEHLTIHFEDGSDLEAAAGIVASFGLDGDLWSASVELVDGRVVALGYVGDDLPFESADVELDPYGTAPLAARLRFETPVPGRFLVRVVGQDGDSSDFIYGLSSAGTAHTLEILGLYPSYENTVELSFTDDAGNVRRTKSVTIVTGEPPQPFPPLEVRIDVPYIDAPPRNTVFMLNLFPGYHHAYVDPFGKIRYVHVYNRRARYGIQRLRNGNLAYTPANTASVLEFSWIGELQNEWRIAEPYGLNHHDVYERENGNFLIPVWERNTETTYDVIVEIDRETSETVAVWDLKDSLQRDRLYPDAEDWAHVNAVVEDPSDGTILVSTRFQGVFKLTQTNEVVWMMSFVEGWDEPFLPFLLEPAEGTRPPMAQHAPVVSRPGHVLMFDNGNRPTGITSFPAPGYSRLVEYAIEEFPEGGGRMSEVFAFGSSRPDLYSGIMGDADLLPESNTFLMTSAALAFNGGQPDLDDPDKARILEVDRAGNVVFEAVVRYLEPGEGAVYRAEKMVLEP